jgi:CheY-like chemotaxis protein
VHVDVAQLEAALINLAVNARDAMPSGGALTITVANLVLGSADIDDQGALRPGPHVKLAVTDSGTGMSPEVLERVWEPFFTTKESGRGTGLGLSQLYGFVQQSDGEVAISSAPGAGTTVTILLPRSTRPLAAEEEPAPAAPPSGAGRVLLVEDQAEVRDVIVAALEDLGYAAATAVDGPQAVRKLREDRFDVLLTDLVLPGGMSGIELARYAMTRDPALKVLLTSGNASATADPQTSGFALLAKPFSRERLGWSLHALLGTPVQAAAAS